MQSNRANNQSINLMTNKANNQSANIISENLTISTNKNNSTAEKLKKKKFYEKVNEHKLSVNQAKKLLNNFA